MANFSGVEATKKKAPADVSAYREEETRRGSLPSWEMPPKLDGFCFWGRGSQSTWWILKHATNLSLPELKTILVVNKFRLFLATLEVRVGSCNQTGQVETKRGKNLLSNLSRRQPCVEKRQRAHKIPRFGCVCFESTLFCGLKGKPKGKPPFWGVQP